MEKVTFELNVTGGAGTRHTVVLKMSPNTGNHECKDSAKRAVAREAERDGWDSRLEFEVMRDPSFGPLDMLYMPCIQEKPQEKVSITLQTRK